MVYITYFCTKFYFICRKISWIIIFIWMLWVRLSCNCFSFGSIFLLFFFPYKQKAVLKVKSMKNLNYFIRWNNDHTQLYIFETFSSLYLIYSLTLKYFEMSLYFLERIPIPRQGISFASSSLYTGWAKAKARGFRELVVLINKEGRPAPMGVRRSYLPEL